MSKHREPLRILLLSTAATLLIAVLPPTAALAQEWECQMCPLRTVTVFGIAVPPLSSDPQLDSGHHLRMKMTGGGVLEVLQYNDPSRDCIKFVSHQLVGPDDEIQDQFLDGFEPILPPPGPFEGADYLATGEITAVDGGSYLLTVRVEAATSREVVASVTIPYDVPAGGPSNGMRAAQQLAPLMGKIRDFERMKRDTNPGVAIGIGSGFSKKVRLEVIPDKEIIGSGESVGTTVRLTDCDDVRLKNNIVATTATGGLLFTENMPTTDDQGEMRVSFTHDEETSRGVINAQYSFVTPFGRETGATESGIVYVEDLGLVAELTKTYSLSVQHPLERDTTVAAHTRIVSRSSEEEMITLQVLMHFDPKPDSINREFDEVKRALVPRKYYYKMTSYEVLSASYTGASTSYRTHHSAGYLTSSLDSSFRSSGGLGEDRETSDTLVIDVDPSGNVTRVSFPNIDIDLAVTSTSRCSKFQNRRTEDCSRAWEWSKTVHTQGGMHGEDECYEAGTGTGGAISGGCHIPWDAGDGRRWEEYGFRWFIHGWTR